MPREIEEGPSQPPLAGVLQTSEGHRRFEHVLYRHVYHYCRSVIEITTPPHQRKIPYPLLFPTPAPLPPSPPLLHPHTFSFCILQPSMPPLLYLYIFTDMSLPPARRTVQIAVAAATADGGVVRADDAPGGDFGGGGGGECGVGRGLFGFGRGWFGGWRGCGCVWEVES